MSIFKDKTLMITGGTGSFGNAVLKHLLRTDIGEIRIFSSDEKKQDATDRFSGVCKEDNLVDRMKNRQGDKIRCT